MTPLKTARRVTSFVAVVTLIACGEERRTGHDAGGLVVRNRPPGTWTRKTTWSLVEEVRIGGGATDEGPSAFGRIVGVELDPLDRVWVADGLQHQIRVFAGDGRHVRSIGRKGAGPGEFRDIAGMDWGPDGNLWVLDAGNARFAVYDTTGKLVTTRSRTANVSMSPWPGGFDHEGRLYDFAVHRQRQESSVTVLARMDFTRGTADTLKLPPFRPRFFGAISRTQGRNTRVSQAPVPFTGRQIWALDARGYVWFASTETYRVERLSPGGSPDRAIELENQAPRVTRAEKDRMLENYAWFERQGGKLDRSLIPDNHPHLMGFYFDDAGNLWAAPSYDVRKNTPLDVFDTAGTYLGRLQGPNRLFATPAPSFRGNRMAAVTGSADGVQSVVVLRIEKPAR